MQSLPLYIFVGDGWHTSLRDIAPPGLQEDTLGDGNKCWRQENYEVYEISQQFSSHLKYKLSGQECP